MLELLTAFAKYVGGFINAAFVKLRAELDVKFQDVNQSFTASLDELENNSSKKIYLKDKKSTQKVLTEEIDIDTDSGLVVSHEETKATLSLKRLLTILEDTGGNKLNIAESSVKFVTEGNLKIDIDDTAKEIKFSIISTSFNYTSSEASVKHVINHNLQSFGVETTVLLKLLDGSYVQTYPGISLVSENQIEIWLTEAYEIICLVKKS